MPERTLPYGYGSIVPMPTDDGTGKVQARWMDRGERRSKVFNALTQDAAHDLAVDHLLKMHRATRDGRSVAPFRMTVADIIDGYIMRNERRLTGRTLRSYRARADSMIVPYIGERRAQELETLHVQQWIDRLSNETIREAGKKPRPRFAPSSIRAAVSVLMASYRDAVTMGIVGRNVVTGVRQPALGNVEVKYWTADDVAKVLPLVRNDPIYGALYVVALATGMRPGELRALQWSNVDLNAATIHVRATISRDGDDGSEQIVRRLKRGNGRSVAISFAVVQALRQHRKMQNERRLKAAMWHSIDIVFDRGDGHWIYQSNWQRFHRALCTHAGVKYITHHGLRHTSASLELEAGTHPKIVADRLGHSGIQITLDLYSHTSADLQRAAAESLGLRLFGESVVRDNKPAKIGHS